ncbi:hypothetical protein [Actinomadura logoneensis]|uniref:hypothetical protein n=1 Tax=Actinomadura logoneensis TaxID=2293572 RepID=UPI0018F1DFF5|nr:hypothetical protein [Actinomadura logoneensis]
MTNDYEDAAAAAVQQKSNGRGTCVSGPTTVPLGLAEVAWDLPSIRTLAERDHTNILSLKVYDRGSHFPAHDAPDLLVGDIWQFFGKVR